MRVSDRAAAVLAALALSGALVACGEEPEQVSPDPGTSPPPGVLPINPTVPPVEPAPTPS